MHETTANSVLRQRAAEKNIPLWMIAKKFGITDSQFSRWLRDELSAERMKQALQYVDEIARDRAAGEQGA